MQRKEETGAFLLAKGEAKLFRVGGEPVFQLKLKR